MIARKVGRHEAGQRLDRWLRKAFPEASLSALFAIIRKKKIRVNGKPGKAVQLVNENDEINIYENLVEGSASDVTAKPVVAKDGWTNREIDPRLQIVLHHEDFLVLDKPAGLASQPGSNQKPGDTLVELLWPWADQQGLDYKPALVHRLDQETSGLIIAALSGQGARGLNARIREHQVRKEYLALVKGILAEPKGTIDLALERTDSAQGAKMDVGSGKEAVTHYQVEQVFADCSLVRIRLETGRMHQIRAHFAAIGHPLLGDGRYGDFAYNRQVRKELGLKRLFLHSALLAFAWNEERIHVEGELPSELKSVLASLAGC